MFRNIVLKQDLINDKKGLESLPKIQGWQSTGQYEY